MDAKTNSRECRFFFFLFLLIHGVLDFCVFMTAMRGSVDGVGLRDTGRARTLVCVCDKIRATRVPSMGPRDRITFVISNATDKQV